MSSLARASRTHRPAPEVDAPPLLDVRGLSTSFFTAVGVAPAVDGVSFTVQRGETLGIVGESGCGKSMTSLSILRLIPDPPGRILGGEVLFEGRELLGLSPQEMRKIRGNQISMIFQEPMTSLNPVFSIGKQIMEAILLHQQVSRREARHRTLDMLKLVGFDASKQERSFLCGVREVIHFGLSPSRQCSA